MVCPRYWYFCSRLVFIINITWYIYNSNNNTQHFLSFKKNGIIIKGIIIIIEGITIEYIERTKKTSKKKFLFV